MNIDDYRGHIDRLIRERSEETVLNGSHAHASVIVERMFANANECVNILSRSFDPRIYGANETVEQARLMLGDSQRTINILVEEFDSHSIANHPFFFKMQRVNGRNLKVRRIPHEIRKAVAINFATLDDYGYRLEEDKSEAVAVANFGDRNFVSSLRSFFDRLWEVSQPVAIPVAA